MANVKKHVADGSQETERVPDGFTEQDLVLGKRAVRILLSLCPVVFVALVAITVYVYQSVPLDTRMPYRGRGGRGGDGLPMQIALMFYFVIPVMWWRTLRKPNSHQMGRGSRIMLYIAAVLMYPGAIIGQLIIAHGILVAGGALPG